MNMKREPEKTLLEKYLEDPEFARLMAQGDLIMEVTETLCELLEKEKISRKELADRLGKSKGFVSQLLNGGRNLTLRTVADILHVLGYKVTFFPYKEGEEEQCDIPMSQLWRTGHKLRWKEISIPETPFAENYSWDDAAISR
jgi:transcriptional regulator with XRE-family HTH domain